ADARADLDGRRAAAAASRPGAGPPAPPPAIDRLFEVVSAAAAAEGGVVGRQGLAEQASVRGTSAAFVAVTAVELGLMGLAFRAILLYASQRRRAEEALERARRAAEDDRAAAEAARAAAEDANRAKDRVLTTVSHDLRTPLGSILLWTQVAGRQTVEPQVREALDAIARSATDQSRLVDDLLDAARAARGTLRVEWAPLDLPDVVRRGCEAVRSAAEAKPVELNIDVSDGGAVDGGATNGGVAEGEPPAAGHTFGDAFRLGQVVWNLVGNAVKFTPPGGRVEVRLSRREAGWLLTVHDTGPGIPPADVPRLFDPFYQADRPNMPKAGGIGMGLAIVKRIVALHGGTVEVLGGDGQGATFAVAIPDAGPPAG
ncbi:MAG: hybrid sensor histidine kinase/response regulator, partial [Phycisphaerales bacterium]|nr:hybrid sensor histidine kinase/response regulator [Phycisphaerales bacterium]